MIKDLSFVIAVRKGSKRIKNKNIKKFSNSSLLKIKLNQIKKVFPDGKIIVSTDCSKSIKIAKKFTKNIDIRPKKFGTNKIPMKEVYKYLASLVKTKYVCYLHVTSPLLKNKTLKKICTHSISNLNKKYDSIATVNEIQEYLWHKNKAINYDPNNHPRSQDLPKFYSLNFAVNIIKTKKMLNEGRIVGNTIFPFFLKFPENIDVDETWDFILAEILYKKFIKNINKA